MPVIDIDEDSHKILVEAKEELREIAKSKGRYSRPTLSDGIRFLRDEVRREKIAHENISEQLKEFLEKNGFSYQEFEDFLDAEDEDG